MPTRLNWARVQKTEDCWNWTGAVNGSGYGPHRDAYREQIHGPMHPKLYVLHHCDNPRCLRIDHLFQGTQSDNMKDMNAKGRNPNAYRFPAGSEHPNFGKTTSDFQKQNMSKVKQRPFSIVAPDGELIHGVNLTKFCRERGLNQGATWQVIHGLVPRHHGYTKAP